jgi:hypothetical protein
VIVLILVSAVATVSTLVYRWAQSAPLTDHDAWCERVDQEVDAKQTRTGST